MPPERKHTCNNLIDLVLAMEKEGKYSASDAFRKLLNEYFFIKEADQRAFGVIVKELDFASVIDTADSLVNVDIKELDRFINGSSPTDSFCGKIILSKKFLKTFHPNIPPEFKKIPPDTQQELIQLIKDRNSLILCAFHKMHEDREADTKRTVKGLVALILKNLSIRAGLSFSDLKRSAGDIIGEIFHDADEIFRATPAQCAELTDDKSIKRLAKEFCLIRRNQDLIEIASLFRKEFERYKVRAEKAF